MYHKETQLLFIIYESKYRILELLIENTFIQETNPKLMLIKIIYRKYKVKM